MATGQGPGKYDDLATYAREKSEALGVIVLVIEGNKGTGFSVQVNAAIVLDLPAVLRDLADQIEGQQQ